MRKNPFLILLVTSTLLAVSCKSPKLTAENFNVTPKPLEVQNGKVTVTIDGTMPPKFIKKKAVVKLIPQLRYNNTHTNGNGITLQGEKVLGNEKTISYKLGGRYTLKTEFDYQPQMQQSELFVTFKTKKKLPELKLADGVIATAELYKETMLADGGCMALDSFQRVKNLQQEASIKFLVNQANIRQSELKSNSVYDFIKMLQKINDDREKLNLKNIEVKAYASPEGQYDFNDKLAGKRKNAGEAYVKQQLKQKKMNSYIDGQYTAEDWDGFQQLVQASNIQDKEVILRVLSMYQDPQEREQQIRNMSVVFQDLAKGILPQLRRARMILNYEEIGKSDEQIKAQYDSDPTKLTPEEILYYASWVNDAQKQEEIYRKTMQCYDKDYRAYNNLAVCQLNKGQIDAAQEALRNLLNTNPNAAEAYANLGLIELQKGNRQEAENLLAKSINANGYEQAQGILNIAKGNYVLAEENLKGVSSNSAALAQILNRNYSGAVATIQRIKNKTYITHYLTAIVNARLGNKETAKQALQEALRLRPDFEAYAAKDLELRSLK